MTDRDLVSPCDGLDKPVAVVTAPLNDEPDDTLDALLCAVGSVDGVGDAGATAFDGSRSDEWLPAAVPVDGPAPTELAGAKSQTAYRRACENVEKWGHQSPTVIATKLVEELGELADEVVPEECPEHREDTVGRSWELLRRAVTTGDSVAWLLEEHYEDDEGDPAEDQPPMVPERDDFDSQAVREELYDVMSLLFQLDWSLYQGLREGDDGD